MCLEKMATEQYEHEDNNYQNEENIVNIVVDKGHDDV